MKTSGIGFITNSRDFHLPSSPEEGLKWMQNFLEEMKSQDLTPKRRKELLQKVKMIKENEELILEGDVPREIVDAVLKLFPKIYKQAEVLERSLPSQAEETLREAEALIQKANENIENGQISSSALIARCSKLIPQVDGLLEKEIGPDLWCSLNQIKGSLLYSLTISQMDSLLLSLRNPDLEQREKVKLLGQSTYMWLLQTNLEEQGCSPRELARTSEMLEQIRYETKQCAASFPLSAPSSEVSAAIKGLKEAGAQLARLPELSLSEQVDVLIAYQQLGATIIPLFQTSALDPHFEEMCELVERTRPLAHQRGEYLANEGTSRLIERARAHLSHPEGADPKETQQLIAECSQIERSLQELYSNGVRSSLSDQFKRQSEALARVIEELPGANRILDEITELHRRALNMSVLPSANKRELLRSLARELAAIEEKVAAWDGDPSHEEMLARIEKLGRACAILGYEAAIAEAKEPYSARAAQQALQLCHRYESRIERKAELAGYLARLEGVEAAPAPILLLQELLQEIETLNGMASAPQEKVQAAMAEVKRLGARVSDASLSAEELALMRQIAETAGLLRVKPMLDAAQATIDEAAEHLVVIKDMSQRLSLHAETERLIERCRQLGGACLKLLSGSQVESVQAQAEAFGLCLESTKNQLEEMRRSTPSSSSAAAASSSSSSARVPSATITPLPPHPSAHMIISYLREVTGTLEDSTDHAGLSVHVIEAKKAMEHFFSGRLPTSPAQVEEALELVEKMNRLFIPPTPPQSRVRRSPGIAHLPVESQPGEITGRLHALRNMLDLPLCDLKEAQTKLDSERRAINSLLRNSMVSGKEKRAVASLLEEVSQLLESRRKGIFSPLGLTIMATRLDDEDEVDSVLKDLEKISDQIDEALMLPPGSEAATSIFSALKESSESVDLLLVSELAPEEMERLLEHLQETNEKAELLRAYPMVYQAKRAVAEAKALDGSEGSTELIEKCTGMQIPLTQLQEATSSEILKTQVDQLIKELQSVIEMLKSKNEEDA